MYASNLVTDFKMSYNNHLKKRGFSAGSAGSESESESEPAAPAVSRRKFAEYNATISTINKPREQRSVGVSNNSNNVSNDMLLNEIRKLQSQLEDLRSEISRTKDHGQENNDASHYTTYTTYYC